MRRIALFFNLLAVVFAAHLTLSAQVSGTYSVVANFTDNAAGGYPVTQLIQAANGDFYGGDSTGGTNGDGVLYQMTPSGTLSVLAQGTANTSGGPQYANLVQGPDGNLWGLAESGGANSVGAILKVSPSGTLTTVYSFTGGSDGSDPTGPLVLGSDGNFYGTAIYGGDTSNTTCQNFLGQLTGCGTIFKVTTGGAFSVVYTFEAGADGAYPEYGLLQGSDGNYYGVQATTVYKLVLGSTNTVTVVATSNQTTEGVYFNGPLVEGRDGAYYGTAQANGSNAYGAVFKVAGTTMAPVYQFTGFTDADGGLPLSGLWAGTDGNFYGTTSQGGNSDCAQGFGCGAVYEVSTAGVVNVLYTFDANKQTNGVLGGPALVQGSNGDLYGTAGNGGSGSECNDSCGVVFSIAVSPAMPAPVVLTPSATSVPVNTAFTLNWKANNAIAISQQQCYAFASSTNAGAWSGKQTGTYSGSTYAYSGSKSLTPTVAGTYTYALTCGGTVSGFATVTVTSGSKAASSTALTYTPNPLGVGQTASLKATVSGSSGTPTGTVTFSIGSTTLGSATLSSGVATLSASTNGIAPGTYPVVATYSGSATYNSSASPTTEVVLNKAATSTTLSASPNPVTPPATETLTATVKRSASGAAGVPTGTVTFTVSTTKLGTAQLNASGVATLSASTKNVAAGTYPVVATYSGDSSDNTSASSAVNVTVK